MIDWSRIMRFFFATIPSPNVTVCRWGVLGFFIFVNIETGFGGFICSMTEVERSELVLSVLLVFLLLFSVECSVGLFMVELTEFPAVI